VIPGPNENPFVGARKTCAAELLGANVASPRYAACTGCPTGSGVASATVAPWFASAADPSVVPAARSRKSTVPVGEPDAVTVAVSVYPFRPDASESVVAVAVLFTRCVSAADVAPVKLVSPAYDAVMLWSPVLNPPPIVNTACPDDCTGADPSAVDPSMKVTDPVGVVDPAADPATVAVNVMAAPASDGFRLDVTVTVEVPRTVKNSGCEVDDASNPLPPYDAVIRCSPALSDAVTVPVPDASSAADPSVVEPSRNVSMPVAGAPSAETVASNVRLWPATGVPDRSAGVLTEVVGKLTENPAAADTEERKFASPL
jgi:hypothetical protein